MNAQMIDQRVVDVIRTAGRETNATPEIVEAVIRSALPSIHLVPRFPKDCEAPRLGGSRIGGLPDLPKGVEWPRLSAVNYDPFKNREPDEPLWFLTQVNLAEVAAFALANLLPKTGIPYFFLHWHDADKPEDSDAGLILLDEGGEQSLRRIEAPADLHALGRFHGFDLAPCRGMDNFELRQHSLSTRIMGQPLRPRGGTAGAGGPLGPGGGTPDARLS